MYVFLLIIAVITSSVSGYAIEGSWKVVDTQDATLPEGHVIKADIKDFIFRNSSIRWTLTFTGCQSFKYMMLIKDNNLYIDLDTFYRENKTQQNCTEQKLNFEKKLQKTIKKVFSFRMIYFLMAFIDPEGNPIIKFERITNNNTDRSPIKGAWMLNSLLTNRIPEMIEINEEKIIFCKRDAEANYNLTNNKLSISSPKTTKCNNQNLLKVLNGTLYFVKRNQTLELYNPNDQVVMSLNYISDLEGLKKIREQQQKLRKNNPFFDKPINPLISTIQTQIDFPIDKYFGKWSATHIFGQANNKKTQFIISKNTFMISHECMYYIQNYSIISQKPFVVKRRTLRQMPTVCKNQDNNLYKTALTKITNLKLSIQGNLIIIRTTDTNGKDVFTLTRPNDIAQFQPPPPQNLNFNPNFNPTFNPTFNPNAVLEPVINPIIKKKDPNQLKQGKYTILLLMRRQIPKKIIKIKNNSFSLTICNQYRVSLQLNNKKQIKIKTQKIKQNLCDLGIQNLFLDFFNKCINYYYDDQDTIIFKDKDNKEIITLNYEG